MSPTSEAGADIPTGAPLDHTTPLNVPQGRAYAGPPVPGRALWAVTVLACPWCNAMHQHRSGETARLLAGRLVKVCPTTGKSYQLAPVQRRREARRAAA